MPTVPTHALAGVGLGIVLAGPGVPPLFHLLTAFLGVAPDLDVIAFHLGIPYGARFGHRGFSHSFVFAALLALAFTPLALLLVDMPWWQFWAVFFVIVSSHDLLDALTDGGLGVGLFSPFDDTRYFLPWRPIKVSPIGLAVFSRWGLRALLSELAWVWLPLACLVVLSVGYRTARP